MSRKQISAQTRGLGVELKELRNKAGLATRDAAKRVGLSPATINRIELGSRVATPEEVFGLLVVYETPVVERERLLDMAREVTMPGWWEGSLYTGVSKHLSALANFESTATEIANMALSVVPGLLQTPDYLRALMACFGSSESEIESRVALCVGRQVVLGKPRAPRYVAILDEAALRRPIAPPAIMADQLRHVVTMMQHHNVTVRVIPFSKGDIQE